MSGNDGILSAMAAFNGNDRRRIGHALKVTGYARMIADGENLPDAERRILEAAAILHDIGIKPAEEKYGHASGKVQEELGPPEARRILSGQGWCEEDLRRVEFLVGHHHTYTLDDRCLQMLIEADFLVNLDEGQFPGQDPAALRDRFFHTKTGLRLFDALYASGPEEGPGCGAGHAKMDTPNTTPEVPK